MIARPLNAVSLAVALAVAGCASGPPPMSEPPVPFAAASGVVIGTFSYQYVESAAGPAEPAWVVHLDKIDAPAAQDYALLVEVDRDSRRGFFTGTLPAGVYTFRDAERGHRPYQASALRMPFQVQAGAVNDAGHYALDPLSR